MTAKRGNDSPTAPPAPALVPIPIIESPVNCRQSRIHSLKVAIKRVARRRITASRVETPFAIARSGTDSN